MTHRLILRIHIDPTLGLGHLARALAIHEEWKALGGQVTLAVSGDERARQVGRGINILQTSGLPTQIIDLGEDSLAPLGKGIQGEVVLFDQKQNKLLYKIAHSLIVREDINWSQPDEDQWPALKYVRGFKGTLEHGQLLYMPEGYWHYMKYVTPGFSMSLRSIARKPKHLAKALYNVLIMRYFDQLMRRLRGQKWIDHKNQQAIERTHRHLSKVQSKSAAAS